MAEIANLDIRTIKNTITHFLEDIDNKTNKYYEEFDEKTLVELKPLPPIAVFIFYLTNSVEYQVSKDILNHKDINLLSFEHQYNFSRSGLQPYLQNLKSEFLNYNVDFSLKHKEYLIGNEHQIRHYFYSLFLNVQIEKILDFEVDAKRIFSFFLDLDEGLDYTPVEKIVLYVYIAQERMKLGSFIDDDLKLNIVDHPSISFDDFFIKLKNDTNYLKYCSSEEVKLQESKYLYLVYSCLNLISLSKISNRINFLTSLLTSTITRGILITIYDYMLIYSYNIFNYY